MTHTPPENTVEETTVSVRRGFSARTETVITLATILITVLSAGVSVVRGDASWTVSTLAIAASTLPILLRLQTPYWALALACGVDAIHIVVAVSGVSHDFEPSITTVQPAPIATAIAAFTVAMYRPQRIAVPLVVFAGVFLGGCYGFTLGKGLTGIDVLIVNVVFVAASVGWTINSQRERKIRQEADRHNLTERAVVEERMRIARELHDALAHNLMVVKAKSSVAEYLVDSDPAAARQALTGITTHVAEALSELRATVGVLRYGAAIEGQALEPIPGLDQVDRLLNSVRSLGSHVSFNQHGTQQDVSDVVDFAAYRIIQECLTNATKHAPGAAITINLDWSLEHLDIDVTNASAMKVAQNRKTVHGYGLIGMRERASSVGGTLTVIEEPGVSFTVRARLPYRDASNTR